MRFEARAGPGVHEPERARGGFVLHQRVDHASNGVALGIFYRLVAFGSNIIPGPMRENDFFTAVDARAGSSAVTVR
jgi:hypothetical protein